MWMRGCGKTRFGAVARAREDAAKRNSNLAKAKDKVHTHASMLAQISKRVPAPGYAEILAVMLPGGPYSDNIESRRRARYAVLAGLRASRLAPADGEHIGYFFSEQHSGGR